MGIEQRSGCSIEVNGQVHTVLATNLFELLGELEYRPDRPGIAVAVNGEVIRKADWGQRSLVTGDRVEIVGAVQGG